MLTLVHAELIAVMYFMNIQKNFCTVELNLSSTNYIYFSGVTTQPIIDRSQMVPNYDTIMPTSLDIFNVFI